MDLEIIRPNYAIIRNETGLADNFVDKFPKSGMRTIVEQVAREFVDGTLYRGDWRKGEIQLTRIVGLVANRYWVEIEYGALFPPKVKGGEPGKGTYRNIVWTSGLEPAAAALPLTTSNEVVLVRQFRHADREWLLEIPRGVRELHETTKECAVRETEEEAGAVVTYDSEVVDLGVHRPDTGILRAKINIYGITNTVIDETKKNRDGTESHLETVLVPIPEFLGWVRDERITDGWTTGAFTRAMAHGLIDLSLLR